MRCATKNICGNLGEKVSVFTAGVFVAGGLLYAPKTKAAIDQPFFRVLPLVVVIAATKDEANGGVAPVVVDFNLLTPASRGSAAPDLIGVDGFVFNAKSGFDAGHDFSGGASRLNIDDETAGGNFGNPGGGDIDYLEPTDSLSAFGLNETTDINVRRARNVSRFLVAVVALLAPGALC